MAVAVVAIVAATTVVPTAAGSVHVPVLELGRTALEIKSAVGAEPWSYPVWVRNENGLLNWILGLAAARLRPPAWEPRNVFRTLAPPDGVVAQAG